MPTPRQIKAAKLLAESGGKGEALIKAGYSKVTSETPTKVTESKGFKEAAEPIVKQLEKLRDQAIRRAYSIGDKAGYDSAIRAIDGMTKNIQLLGGKPTEIKQDNYDNLTTDELISRLDAIRRGKNRGGTTNA